MTSALLSSIEQFTAEAPARLNDSPTPKLDPLLDILHDRRVMDLSDLDPAWVIPNLIVPSTVQILPDVAELEKRLRRGTLKVKFGIDPTGADVHLGHAVPIFLASRLQRLGSAIDFVIGDVTARIGDPSGRNESRPPLTKEEIDNNLSTYTHQLAPVFDFEIATLHKNSEWLDDVRLDEILSILARVPVSRLLQREDFRNRLSSGAGLTMAELMYSVVMALDSVALMSDLEIGGVDQLLNMRMCRTVMEAVGQTAEIILTTPLIEGTDGSGNKMSKSLGNYVPLSAPANEIVGKLMSIPDRLLAPYFSSVTELTAPEIAILTSASVPPKAAKELLAVDVAAALRGKEAALTALDEFRMQFGSRSYRLLKDLPEIDLIQSTPASLIEVLQNAMGDVSRSHLRRLTDQSAIRVVFEGEEGERHRVVVTPSILDAPVSGLLAIVSSDMQTDDQIFLRVGSKLVFRLVTHE